MKILVINPGGTSTKIAVFEDEEELFKENITHTGEDLKGFPHVFDQFGYRKDIILETLKKAGFEIRTFAAVAGRGGLMNPIPGGTYTVNSLMVEDLRGAIHGEHPSNLGAVLAKEIGDEIGASSFVVDPVSVDELMQVQSQTPPEAGCTERGEITVLALRAVALAMGVAVAVLSMMKQLDLNSGFTMLGVGLACGMLSLFGRKSR